MRLAMAGVPRRRGNGTHQAAAGREGTRQTETFSPTGSSQARARSGVTKVKVAASRARLSKGHGGTKQIRATGPPRPGRCRQRPTEGERRSGSRAVRADPGGSAAAIHSIHDTPPFWQGTVRGAPQLLCPPTAPAPAGAPQWPRGARGPGPGPFARQPRPAPGRRRLSARSRGGRR